MSTILVLGSPIPQFFKTGTPEYLSGGKIYTYDAGTLDARATYPTVTDAINETNANPNPITLNSRGEPENGGVTIGIVIKGPTKVILKDSSLNTIYTFDNLAPTVSNDIVDSNGNELLKFSEVVNAVNELTITNAVAGSSPIMSATGDDTNIGITLTPKGSGILNISATSAIKIPSGTTGQEPSSPAAGYLRWNTTLGYPVFHNGTTWLYPNIVRCYLQNNQGVATSTPTKILMATENLDTNSNFSSNRFTPTQAGRYLIYGQLQWATAGAGAYIGYIYLNGSVRNQVNYQASATAADVTLTLCDIIDMNGTTDFVEIYANQNTGATRTVNAGAAATIFAATRIANL